MAQERLACSRDALIVATSSDSVRFRARAIVFNSFQKGSSRLTLVLCPPTTIDRLTTEDFIRAPQYPLPAVFIALIRGAFRCRRLPRLTLNALFCDAQHSRCV